MKRSTKIIIISTSLIGIVALAFLLWYLFLRPGETEPSPSAGGLPVSGETLPTSQAGGVAGSESQETTGGATSISDHPVFDFWLNKETGEVFYIDPQGMVWSAKTGPDVELSSQGLSALNAITTSPKGTRILASFGDPHNPQWGIFDVIDAVWRPLPASLLNVTWGGDEETLIGFVRGENQTTNLSRISLASAQPKTTILTENMRLLDVRLSFSPPSSLFLAERPAAGYEGRVWKFDASTKTLNLVLTRPGLLFDTAQTPDIAFWSSEGKEFDIIDTATFSSVAPVPFVTFPEKCTATAELIACFAPRTLNPFPPRVFPDDYLTNAFRTADDLFFINLQTLEINTSKDTTLLETAFDGWHPVIHNNKTLYTLNKRDNKLYTTALPVTR